MRWRIISLASLLSITIALSDCSRFVAARSSHPLLSAARRSHTDAESLLAQGRLLPLLCSNANDLELLPGVTDRVAGELLASADTLARLTPELAPQDALLHVHGIGPKRAAFFAEHLDLSASCRGRSHLDGPPP
jgi:hypothetical protein